MQFLHNRCRIDWPGNLAVTALYLILAKIGLVFALQSPTITIFWPAGGFALAILLLGGLKYLPGIFIGGVAAGFMAVNNPEAALMLGLADAAESFSAYWLLTRRFHFNNRLDSRQDFLKLTLLVAPIACGISALVGPTSMWLGNLIPFEAYFQTAMRWWMGDLLGIAFMTPLILAWCGRNQKADSNASLLEMAALQILTFLTGQAIFFDWFESVTKVSLSIAWIIPLMIWAGLRTGRRNTSALQLMVFIQALWSAGAGTGHYADDMAQSGLLNFWLFGMVVALGDMALAVMATENLNIYHELQSREQKNTANDERLRLALRAAKQGWFDLDLTTGQVSVSPDYPKLLGYDPAEFKSSLQRWQEDLHPDDRSAVMAAFNECLATGGPVSMEYRRRIKTGEWVWLRSIGEVTEWAAQRQPLRMTGIHTNITEYKQTLETLRDSEEQLRLVLEGAELGFWDWNIITGEVKRNERWARMLGYSYEEIQNTTQQWADFVHPDDREMAWQSIYDVTEGRSKAHKLEYRMLHKDGSIRWILDQANVMQRDAKGNTIRMSGTHTDITMRKLEILQSERFEAIVNSSTDAIISNNLDSIVISWNAGAEIIFGYNAAEMLGQSMRTLFPKGLLNEEDSMLARIRRGEQIKNFETVRLRKDGALVDVSVTISPIRDGAGNVVGVSTIARDISEQKRMELELKRQAHVDYLTGVSNRRHFMEQAEQEFGRAARYDTPLSLFMLDIDFFKRINDSYGHKAGDAVLKKLADVCRKTLREVDIVGRVGGEEFAIMLPETGLDEAVEIAERLREAIAVADVPLDGDGVSLHFTVSIGVTALTQGASNIDALMNRADKAMYKAKESGRDKVCAQHENPTRF